MGSFLVQAWGRVIPGPDVDSRSGSAQRQPANGCFSRIAVSLSPFHSLKKQMKMSSGEIKKKKGVTLVVMGSERRQDWRLEQRLVFCSRPSGCRVVAGPGEEVVELESSEWGGRGQVLGSEATGLAHEFQGVVKGGWGKDEDLG